MRTSIWLLCLIALCLAAVFTARAQKLMSDPLFGISYDPGVVRFEEAPARISKECSELRDQKTWVYCRAKLGDVDYFIVSGFMRQCPDGPGSCKMQPDTTGSVLALRGSMCSAEAADGFYWQKDDPLWNLPPTALDEMARDALRRYATAFGGKKNFLGHLTPRIREFLHPAVRKQLEAFEKEPDK